MKDPCIQWIYKLGMIRKHSIKIKYNDTNIFMDIMRYSTLPKGPLGENSLKKYQLNLNLKEEK